MSGVLRTPERTALSSRYSDSPKAGSLIGSHRGENSDNGDLSPDSRHHNDQVNLKFTNVLNSRNVMF